MRNKTGALVSRRTLMRNGLLLASGCACAPSCLAKALYRLATAGAADGGQSWTIGNKQIRRKIAYEAKTEVFTEQFSDLLAHAEFVVPGKMRRSQEFSFLCNGHACAGTNAEF
jgi:hypothetical protein